MLTVVLIMTAGIVTGYFIRNFKNIVKIADKLTVWAIYLLLFLLGVAIGANELIMKNLPTLGLKALYISVGGVLGSVFTAWVIYHFFFKVKGKDYEG